MVSRSMVQHLMAFGLPIIVIGGLFIPRLGLLAGGLMLTSIVLSLRKGRFWCGWVCPRGSFLDRWLALVTLNRPIPKPLLKPRFRWSVFTLLMSLMATRLAFAGNNLDRVGSVFVMLCLVTTMVAVSLGILYKARTWCTFCPMGTLQSQMHKLGTNYIGSGKGLSVPNS
jgi:ferredoxin-type protein NapH